MKKKVLLPVIALLVTLALSLFTVACGGADVKFKVTAEYDAAKGSVTIADADGKAATTFKAGDRVIVTVTPNEGFVVDEFKVNGVAEALNNGVYACFASSNILVNVTFKEDGGGEKPPEPIKPITESDFIAAYDSVKTTFVADGQYTYKAEGEDPVVNSITTIFGEGAVNILEIDASTGDVLYDDVYVDVKGSLAMPVHTLDNKIEYVYPTPTVEYSEYDNPFKLLTTSDFAATDENGVFALTTADKKDGAATALTGYTETIADFKVTVSDGKITKVNIVTDRIERTSTDGESKFYYTATYAYTLSDWGEAEVDEGKISPYETKPEHTALKAALAAAGQAKNYTIAVDEFEFIYDADSEAFYFGDEIEYNVFVTEKAIYIDCLGWEEGFVEVGAGIDTVVYPFTYDPETESGILYDASVFPTVASMRASFNGFAPEIFELDDDGYYVLREEMDTTENVRGVLINFGEGVDQIRLYGGYTYNVAFKLNADGGLDEVELMYLVDGIFNRTLKYTAWNETELPITFDNFETKSVLDDYVGTYTDGTHTAVIDGKTIFIDGEPFEVTEYSIQYDMFMGSWKGGEWYITKQAQKQLIVYTYDEETEDYITYVLTSTALDPVEIPDEFNGAWSKGEHLVAIAYGKIEYDGNMLTVLSYDEKDGSLYAADGEYTYRFFAETVTGEDDEEKEMLLAILYVDGMSTAYLDLTKDETVAIIPEPLVGTFEKYDGYYYMNFKVKAGLTTVALEFGTDKPTVTVTQATNNGYAEVKINVDGVEYFIQEGYKDNQVMLGSDEPNTYSVTLERVEDVTPPATFVEVPEKYYGEYEGEDNGTTYYITITADGITVKIGDGEVKTATVTAYDELWDALTLDIDGEEYGIAANYQDETAIDFSNSDYTIYVTLNRKANAVVLPEKFYGTYEGAAGGVDYIVLIAEDGVTVSVGGVDAAVANVGYDETEGYITLTLDGTEYMIMDSTYDEPISKIMLATFDYSVMVTLNRVTE